MQVAGLPLTFFSKLRSSSARISSSENKTNSLDLSVIFSSSSEPAGLGLDPSLQFRSTPSYGCTFCLQEGSQFFSAPTDSIHLPPGSASAPRRHRSTNELFQILPESVVRVGQALCVLCRQ